MKHLNHLALSLLVLGFTCSLPAAESLPAGVVFTCDFESPTWWQEWAVRQKDAHTDTVREDAARKFEPHRGKALRIRVDQNGHYGVSLDFNFKKRTGAEPEEIFFRYYVRFADYHVYIDDVAISRQPIGPLPAQP